MNLQEKTISLLKLLGKKLPPTERVKLQIQGKLHLNSEDFEHVVQNASDFGYIEVTEEKIEMTAKGVARFREIQRKEFDALSPDIFNQMYDRALYTFLDKDEFTPIAEFPEILINECPVNQFEPRDNISEYLSQKEDIEDHESGYRLLPAGKARLGHLRMEKGQ